MCLYMYLQIYVYHEQHILHLHSFAFHVFMDLLKDCVVSFYLIDLGHAMYQSFIPTRVCKYVC